MLIALLGFFSMKNPSLCCEAAFGLRVTLQQSGLARPKSCQALAQHKKQQASSEVVLCVAE
jgi:hypothetical protein